MAHTISTNLLSSHHLLYWYESSQDSTAQTFPLFQAQTL